MASKPDLIFVPGAWHGPGSFSPTSQLLEKAGYKVHGILLPSVGPAPHIQSIAPDVDVIRSKVNSLLSSGKDVVMIYHSYGSVPGMEALAEYVKKLENGKQDDQGKIRRLVFCASFILPEGGSLMAGLGGNPLPWFKINGDEILPADPAAIFYNDFDEATAKKYVDLIQPHAFPTFSSQITVAPWKVIPSTYIVCEKDMAIPLPGQEGMLAMAEQMAPDSFDIERCDAGHSPFISQPEWLAEKLIKAASK